MQVKLSPTVMRPELCGGQLALSSSPTEENCMAMYFPWHYLRRDLGLDLAFCRVGDTRWRSVTADAIDNHLRPITGLVYSKRDKLFYALTSCGRIEAFDLNDSSPSSSSLRRFDPAPRIVDDVYKFGREASGESLTTCWKYLVESPEGEPLLVIWYGDGREEDEERGAKTIGFHVYKLNFSKKKGKVVLEEFNMESTTLFVSQDSSFCLPVRDYPGLIPSSVYFFGHTEICMYNLLDRSLTRFHQPPDKIDMDYIRRDPMWVAKPQ